jgi:hypothetical protein
LRELDGIDRKAMDVDFAKAGLVTLKSMLPLQTVTYIAGRVKAVPEMVASRFYDGVAMHRRTDTANAAASNYLNDLGSKYVSDVMATLREMGDARGMRGSAQAMNREMAFIGMEASRIGFDYRLNWRDNQAKYSELTAADKASVDEVHRRFTQLQRTNPEVAAHIEEGERIGLRAQITRTATIASRMLDASVGRARHLEAELAQMTPADARYAELESRVKLLTTESILAQQHSKGLDFQDPTLGQGKTNPDPKRFQDAGIADLGSRLERMFAEARKLPDGSPLKQTIGALESIHAATTRHPYFSLGRDGEFFVKVGFKGIDAATNARIQKVAAEHAARGGRPHPRRQPRVLPRGDRRRSRRPGRRWSRPARARWSTAPGG